MYYLIDWKNGKVVFTGNTEQECRDIRKLLINDKTYDDMELVIAMGIE